ncbi:DUF924 family protein [Chitinimonas naiadis]
MADEIEAVLAFWFPNQDEAQRAWFVKDPAFDTEIAQRFGHLLATAMAGGLQSWCETPRGLLAYVLLLDQFSRNCHRADAQAYAGDALALAAAGKALAQGWDRQLGRLQRVFLYLPFEHAEDAAMQLVAVRCFEALAAEFPDCEHYLDYAYRHRDVIARFGRFPHRNAVLGRVSTPAELAYLAEPGSGF